MHVIKWIQWNTAGIVVSRKIILKVASSLGGCEKKLMLNIIFFETN